MSDAPACSAILSDWVAETPWFPNLHSRAEDLGFMQAKIRDAVTLLAEEDGTVLGFLALEGEYVACLYLAACARGRGIGRDLLSAAKDRSDRLTLWTFAANTGAQAFYRREGFCAARRTDGDNEEGLPDIEFVWQRGKEQA